MPDCRLSDKIIVVSTRVLDTFPSANHTSAEPFVTLTEPRGFQYGDLLIYASEARPQVVRLPHRTSDASPRPKMIAPLRRSRRGEELSRQDAKER
jgi:hypothetical protein